jgi:hypothetical protein
MRIQSNKGAGLTFLVPKVLLFGQVGVHRTVSPGTVIVVLLFIDIASGGTCSQKRKQKQTKQYYKHYVSVAHDSQRIICI